MKRTVRVAGIFAAVLACSIAAGCGGGGGGAGPQQASRQPAPEPETTETEAERAAREEAARQAEAERAAQEEEMQRRQMEEDQRRAREAALQQELERIDRLDLTVNLSAVGVREAHKNVVRASGGPVPFGADITIGFIDTGIEPTHPAFAPGARTVTEEPLETGAGDPASSFTPPERSPPGGSSHGTAVASVAAGAARNVIIESRTESRQGVAPGANVRMFAITLGSGGGDYQEVTLAGLERFSRRFGGFLSHALSQDVDVLNMSLSVSGIIDHYSEADLQGRMTALVSAAAQEAKAENKTILVWSAGNLHGDPCMSGQACDTGTRKVDARSVTVSAGLPLRFPEELRGHWIAVAAVDDAGVIASFSNRCGSAAGFCIAAPGVGVPTAYYGYHDPSGGVVIGEGRGSGTSFAAPTVAGGLALMKQLFRGQLSSEALVARLFTTANRDGRYADRSVYGQGLMDLGAATAPVGAMTVAGGASVAGGGANLRETGLALGPAFGDGLAAALTGREIAAFDSLGAPFWFDLGGLVAVTDPSPPLLLARRLRALTAPAARRSASAPGWTALTFDAGGAGTAGAGGPRMGLLGAGTDAPPAGHLALADGALAAAFDPGAGLAATAFTNRGAGNQPPVSGGALSWRAAGAPAGLTAGWLTESAELLGTGATGAFGRLAADTTFLGVDANLAVGPWAVSATGEIGAAAARNRRGGLVAGLSPLTTSAFALDATRRLADGSSVRLTLAQPLRVENGRATFSVPVGRTRGGAVQRRSVVAGLEPSGRQIDVTAQWRRPFAAGGDVALGVAWTHAPGHAAGAKPDLAVMAGWRLAF